MYNFHKTNNCIDKIMAKDIFVSEILEFLSRVLENR